MILKIKYYRQYQHLLIPVIASILLFSGLLYLYLPKVQAALTRSEGERINTSALNEQTKTAVYEPELRFGRPLELHIERLGVRLPVTAGSYDATRNEWLLDRTHVFYMEPGTYPLAQSAPAMFYGHNIPEVFRPLDGIAKDELLQIVTADGRILNFGYVEDKIVLPAEGAALNNAQNVSGISLVTCTGVHFEHRRIMFFAYKGTVYTKTVQGEAPWISR